MSWKSKYREWFVSVTNDETTEDNKDVEIWEYKYNSSSTVMSKVAKLLRNEYCLDSLLKRLRRGTKYTTNSEYLTEMKFPDPDDEIGEKLYSGDTGEFIVANFLEYKVNCWVPHQRFTGRPTRNSMITGSDVIGLRMTENEEDSAKDLLVVCEVKTRKSGSAKSVLQESVNSSMNDPSRKGETLDALKLKYLEKDKSDERVDLIERFQDELKYPYREIYLAAIVIEDRYFKENIITSTDSSNHPKYEKLKLAVFKVKEFEDFIEDLYERAANEA